jgi:hypothetical protein
MIRRSENLQHRFANSHLAFNSKFAFPRFWVSSGAADTALA